MTATLLATLCAVECSSPLSSSSSAPPLRASLSHSRALESRSTHFFELVVRCHSQHLASLHRAVSGGALGAWLPDGRRRRRDGSTDKRDLGDGGKGQDCWERTWEVDRIVFTKGKGPFNFSGPHPGPWPWPNHRHQSPSIMIAQCSLARAPQARPE